MAGVFGSLPNSSASVFSNSCPSALILALPLSIIFGRGFDEYCRSQ
jgi:hypothetical protein